MKDPSIGERKTVCIAASGHAQLQFLIGFDLHPVFQQLLSSRRLASTRPVPPRHFVKDVFANIALPDD
jgi:hypothetical protein